MKTIHIGVDIDESLLSIMKVTKENSGEVLKQLAAVTLFQSKKLSLWKAAQLAGMTKREFEDFLFDLGIPYEFYTIENLEQDMKTLGLK